MTNILSEISFGINKKSSFEKGAQIRKRFNNQIDRLTRNRPGDRFTHGYIYSPPGIGKTYTILKQLQSSQINHIKITGNVSMYAFGIQLCVISHLNPNKEKVVVFVDDCDSLFSTEENCNTMKNVLDGTKRFTYEKSLQSQWSNLSEVQKEAVRFHQHDDRMGFEVPTDTMTFIFASNFKLPLDDDIKKVRNKSTSRSILMAHKNAIRSRCTVGDFDLNDAELWGWIADVTINTECLNVFGTENDLKIEILNFLWDNWESLTERSIRLVEKMAVVAIEYPENYRVIWQIDFLK